MSATAPFATAACVRCCKPNRQAFLRQLIKSDTFVPERLEVDKQMLRDFYLSRGYIDVQVVDATGQLSRERDATFVTYTVREGQSWKIGKVSTVSEVRRRRCR